MGLTSAPLSIPVLERLFRSAERRAFSTTIALATPVWVALVRMLGERFLSIGETHYGRSPSLWFAHIVGFYMVLHVTLGAVLVKLANIDWKRASLLVGVGLVLGTVPPFIDVAIYGRGQFTYEYMPGAIPWSLHRPPHVLPWGETTVLWLTIVLMTLTVLRATRSVVRTLAAPVITYGCVMFFLVALPALSHVLSQRSGIAPSEWLSLSYGVVTMGSLIIALGLVRRFFARAPQWLLPALFGLVGAGLKGALTPAVGLAVLTLVSFGAAFALSNDWYDRKEDAVQGRALLLDAHGAQLLSIVPLVFAFHILMLRVEAGLCLVGFAIVAHAYHADPFRLKCVFPLSYKTEGLLAGLALIAGLTAAPDVQPTTLQLWVVLVVTLGTPLALVFKDAKDIDADASAGVKTAFVIARARGWSDRRTEWVSATLLAVALAVASFGLTQLRAPTMTVLGTLIALTVLAPGAFLFGLSARVRVIAAMILAEAHLAVVIAALIGLV